MPAMAGQARLGSAKAALRVLANIHECCLCRGVYEACALFIFRALGETMARDFELPIDDIYLRCRFDAGRVIRWRTR